MSNDDDQSGFVEDGAGYLAEAVRSNVFPRIQAEVTAEYSDRLAAAGFLRRIWLRRCLKAEVECRVRDEIKTHMPPNDTLW